MKKTDQNVIIITLIGIIGVTIWISSRYIDTNSKKQSITQQDTIKLENNAIKKEKNIIPTITPIQLQQNTSISSNTISIIDVRNIESYNSGHIRDSIQIKNMDTTKLRDHIVLVNDTGSEETLIQLFRKLSKTKKVSVLQGGISSWTNSGFPIISLKIQQTFQENAKIIYVEPRELDARLQKKEPDFIIIDMQRFNNYTREHIPYAINIPFTQSEQNAYKIPTVRTIYVYNIDEQSTFASGVMLYNLGFTNVKTIKGGLNAWKKYNYPIVSTITE